MTVDGRIQKSGWRGGGQIQFGGHIPCIPFPEYAPVKVHKLCSMFRITQIKLSWLKSPSENWLSMCKCLKNRMINIGN